MPYKDPADKAAAQKRWYEENGRGAIIAKTAEYRERNQRIVEEAKNKPCEDCGHNFPTVCMDLHHVRGEKLGTVSSMSHYPVGEAKLRAEIKKCIVICANCHRIRHHVVG